MGRTMSPRNRDALVVTVVAAFALVEALASPGLEPRGVAVVCHLAMVATLWWWSRRPVPVALAVGALNVVEAAGGVPLDEPLTPMLAYLVAVYGVASRTRTRIAVPTLGAVVVLESVAAALAGASWGNVVFAAAVMSVPFGAGVVVRHRGAETRVLREHAARLEADREREAALAARTERARIARELHDVISHSVGLMVVQAAAAERVLPTDPDRAAQSLQAVQRAGREALTELAGMLGVLRDGAEIGLAPGSDLVPQPGLEDLDALAEHHRRTGLDVDLDVSPRQLGRPAACSWRSTGSRRRPSRTSGGTAQRSPPASTWASPQTGSR